MCGASSWSADLRRWSRFVAIGLLVACGDTTSPLSSHPQSLVAEGRVVDASGAPVDGALVQVQALWPGEAGGEFGCRGTYLVGQWTLVTPSDGEFGIEIRLNAPSSPTCLVVLGMRAGETAWRDTASVVARFTPVAKGVTPDTVHFDLMFPP